MNDVIFIRFERKNANQKEKIVGKCELNKAVFKFSFTKQAGKQPCFRGTITARGSKGEVIKGKNKKGINDKPIARHMIIYGADDSVIKNKIANGVKVLNREHVKHIRRALGESFNPATITPAVAAQVSAEQYIKEKRKTVNEKYRKELAKRIKMMTAELPDKPMKNIDAKDIDKVIKAQGWSRENIMLLSGFWDYCLQRRKCEGKNPVTIPPKKKKSNRAKIRADNKVDRLPLVIQEEILDYVMAHNTGPNRGMALILGGGLTREIAVKLCWNDFYFGEDPEFVIVKVFYEHVGCATKNYSRPLMPKAALIMREAYMRLCEKYGEKKVGAMPVVSFTRNDKRAITEKRLTGTVRNYLQKNYVDTEHYVALTNNDLNLAAAIRVLRNSCEDTLRYHCGMDDIPGLVDFYLCRSLAGNTTADHYHSFTSEEGQYYIYSCFQCLSSEVKVPNVEEKSAMEIKMLSPKPGDYHRERFVILPDKSEVTIMIDSIHGVDISIRKEKIHD